MHAIDFDLLSQFIVLLICGVLTICAHEGYILTSFVLRSNSRTVSVKWMGKQTFEDVDLDPSESPATFKAQLFAVSGVPPDRIKLMLKGKMIKVRIIATFQSTRLNSLVGRGFLVRTWRDRYVFLK